MTFPHFLFADDKTRVVLTTDSPNGNDYINASYVIVSTWTGSGFSLTALRNILREKIWTTLFDDEELQY